MKPSDALGYIMIGGLVGFVLWVCIRSAGSFDNFIRGVLWVAGLALLAAVLITAFQVGYPGH